MWGRGFPLPSPRRNKNMIPTLNQLSTGQFGNVKSVIKNACARDNRYLDTELNERDRPVRVMDFDHVPTLREMCLKYGANFIAVLEHNRRMKLVHDEGKKGYGLGINRARIRYTAEVPVEISGNPRNPLYWIYFNPQCTDPIERRKNLYKFLRKYDMAFSPIWKL